MAATANAVPANIYGWCIHGREPVKVDVPTDGVIVCPNCHREVKVMRANSQFSNWEFYFPDHHSNPSAPRKRRK